jgi:TolB protein
VVGIVIGLTLTACTSASTTAHRGRRNGAIAFTLLGPHDHGDIHLIDPDGRRLRNLTHSPGDERSPAWSPDGRRLAYVLGGMKAGLVTSDLFVMSGKGHNRHRLTSSGGVSDQGVSWSPDGRKIVFAGVFGGLYGVGVGGGAPKTIVSSSVLAVGPSWSPDGRQIAFSGSSGRNDYIQVVQATGGKPRDLTKGPGSDFGPRWAPDGSRITFCRELGRKLDIFVMRADGGGERRLTRTSDACEPEWSPNGAQIAFTRSLTGVFVMNAKGAKPRRLVAGPVPLLSGLSWQPLR